MNYEERMENARKKMAAFSQIEAEYDQAPLEECGPAALLDVAQGAIEAGIRNGDWDCVAEGQVMLEQAMAQAAALQAVPGMHVMSEELLQQQASPILLIAEARSEFVFVGPVAAKGMAELTAFFTKMSQHLKARRPGPDPLNN